MSNQPGSGPPITTLGVLSEAWDITYYLCREGAITEALRHEIGVLLMEMELVVEGKMPRPYGTKDEMRVRREMMSKEPLCDYCHHVHSPTQDHYLG